jgi:phage major head subunit gpT-like protein
VFNITSTDILAMATLLDTTLRDAYLAYTPTLTGCGIIRTVDEDVRGAYPVQAASSTMTRWVGARESTNLWQETIYIENGKPFQQLIPVSRRDMQLLGKALNVSSIAMREGKSARALVDTLIADKLKNGKTITAVDGKAFFATDHPVSPKNSGLGTYTNLRTSFPLNRANFRTAYQDLKALKGWDGLPFQVDGVILLVPPAMEAQAQSILKEGLVANDGTASGTSVASVNVDVGKARLIVSPMLLESDVWYLLSYIGQYNDPVMNGTEFDSQNRIVTGPFAIQQWRPLEFVPQVDLTSPSVFQYDEFQFGISRGVEVGFLLPEHAVRCEA